MRILPADGPPRALDGKLHAEQNLARLLLTVRNFGHLRTAEAARIGWPQSPPASAEEMARRTIHRALRRGLVLERSNTLGGRSYVLTARGAAEVGRQWELPANDGYDIQGVTGPTFRHRTIGTAYLAERIAHGHRAWGEYAINKQWAPVSREALFERFCKLPDGLVAVSPAMRGYDPEFTILDWVEVESTYKPMDALERVLAVAWRLGTQIDHLIVDRLVLVYDAIERHEKRIVRAATQLAATHPESDNQAVFESVDLARCSLALPLRLKKIDTVVLSDAMQLQPR